MKDYYSYNRDSSQSIDVKPEVGTSHYILFLMKSTIMPKPLDNT